jgi:hypothetical protein
MFLHQCKSLSTTVGIQCRLVFYWSILNKSAIVAQSCPVVSRSSAAMKFVQACNPPPADRNLISNLEGLFLSDLIASVAMLATVEIACGPRI